MNYLYTTAAIRQLEELAFQQAHMTASELMQRAGQAIADALQNQWPKAKKVVVFCGKGKNGGDGYIAAHLLQQRGLEVFIYQLAKIDELQGEALAAAKNCVECNIPSQLFDATIKQLNADVIIDALFGIGLQRPISGIYQQAIHCINESRLPILAVDIPSGLDADKGNILGYAVQATLTVTFIALKPGLLTGQGKTVAGLVQCEKLGLATELYQQVRPAAQLITEMPSLPKRPANAHKGQFGHVLVVGGDYGMGGAVRMAAEAALRVGAGLVTVATRLEHIATVISERPELMCKGIHQADELLPLIDKATVIVIGPGLGQQAWGENLWQKVLQASQPKVVDADGLNFLAKYPQQQDQWILTPHPGEAARLLNTTTAAVQADRLILAAKLQQQFGGVCVLKGAGTVIQTAESIPTICGAGNPGMATAGMGDVLSGVIAGLLAQGLSLSQAAKNGVLLHSLAADSAVKERGERGLLALDLMPYLRQWINR